MLYGFATLDFHPGAVYGRVAVVYAKNPEAFDRASLRLMKFAVKVFHNKTGSVADQGSLEQQNKLPRGRRRVPQAEASGGKGIPVSQDQKAELGMP